MFICYIFYLECHTSINIRPVLYLKIVFLNRYGKKKKRYREDGFSCQHTNLHLYISSYTVELYILRIFPHMVSFKQFVAGNENMVTKETIFTQGCV